MALRIAWATLPNLVTGGADIRVNPLQVVFLRDVFPSTGSVGTIFRTHAAGSLTTCLEIDDVADLLGNTGDNKITWVNVTSPTNSTAMKVNATQLTYLLPAQADPDNLTKIFFFDGNELIIEGNVDDIEDQMENKP